MLAMAKKGSQASYPHRVFFELTFLTRAEAVLKHHASCIMLCFFFFLFKLNYYYFGPVLHMRFVIQFLKVKFQLNVLYDQVIKSVLSLLMSRGQSESVRWWEPKNTRHTVENHSHTHTHTAGRYDQNSISRYFSELHWFHDINSVFFFFFLMHDWFLTTFSTDWEKMHISYE